MFDMGDFGVIGRVIVWAGTGPTGQKRGKYLEDTISNAKGSAVAESPTSSKVIDVFHTSKLRRAGTVTKKF